MWETQVRSLGWEDPLEKKMAPHTSTLAWKIPWTEEPGRLQSMGSHRVRHDYSDLAAAVAAGQGNGTPHQYSCLENPMDRGTWWATVHGVAKSRARLSDFTFTFHFHALEKEMATHSSVLAWRIPGTGEPGGLQSVGSHRVGHDWSNLAAAAVMTFLSDWILHLFFKFFSVDSIYISKYILISFSQPCKFLSFFIWPYF